MGGEYHSLLLEAASAGGLGLLAFFGALAWGGSQACRRRKHRRRPSPGTSTGHRGALCQRTPLVWGSPRRSNRTTQPRARLRPESPLALAAWVLACLARAFVRVVAGTVIAARRAHVSPRTLPLAAPHRAAPADSSRATHAAALRPSSSGRGVDSRVSAPHTHSLFPIGGTHVSHSCGARRRALGVFLALAAAAAVSGLVRGTVTLDGSPSPAQP